VRLCQDFLEKSNSLKQKHKKLWQEAVVFSAEQKLRAKTNKTIPKISFFIPLKLKTVENFRRFSVFYVVF